MLRYAIAFAVRRAGKIVRGLRHGLTEDERYAATVANASATMQTRSCADNGG
mgnify:CR=1 FL=1